MAKKPKAVLSDINLAEVSVVDRPANARRFLFVKQDSKKKLNLSIAIESDGSRDGTTVSVNGKKIDKLRDFSFSLYPGSVGDSGSPLHCSYSRMVETEDGFERAETYYLAKGDVPMDKELKKALLALLGDEKDVAVAKADNTVLTKALETIAKYQEDFPADLAEAIEKTVLHAILPFVKSEDSTSKEDEEDEEEDKEAVSKKGKKFSSASLKLMREVVAAGRKMEAMLPKDDDAADTATKGDDLKKSVETLTQQISEMGKAHQAETAKLVTALDDRLKMVEKTTGTKKSVNGQETDSSSETTGLKWPSITKGSKIQAADSDEDD